MKNLKLYVTPEDYAVFAGPDWPSYDNLIAGVPTGLEHIDQEVREFVDMHTKQGIRFPIRSATACQSKWTWSTLWLNRLSTSSCHRVNPVPFALDQLENFHNIPQKIRDREQMLAGEWPGGGCEYCRDIERAGGWSDRQHNLEIRGLTPPELETNSLATHVTPRLVEIFAQNTCNLACIYCNATLSSRIEQENAKFGDFDHNGVKISVEHVPEAADEYFQRWLAWLEQNIHHIHRLHLLGGETFLQHKLMNSVLDIIQRRPNPKLEFCVFSNFNVPDNIWNRYINRIHDLQQQGHIRVFDLTASIDCWGPAAEYVRSGLDLAKFERRFAWAAEQGPWMRLTVNQTITAMTIRTMPELIEKIAYYSQHRHIGQYFEFYVEKNIYQHPRIFAWDFWREDFDRIFAVLPRSTPEQKEVIQRMSGIQKLLEQSKTHNYNEIKKLHTYLDELDRRRHTNWRSLFSYLDIHEFT